MQLRVLGPTLLLFVAACAPSSHLVTGVTRPAIPVSEVKVYSSPPTFYKEIAILNANARSAFGTGGQKQIDTVVERLKTEAAALGANGVLLEGFSDVQTGSIGTGVGSQSYGSHSSVGVGVGGGFGIYKKTGQGRAIYVPTPPPSAPVSAPADAAPPAADTARPQP